MTRMRAVTVAAFGAPPELTEIPVPQPGPGELLVRIQSASINPADRKIADGFLKGKALHRFPLVLGADGAGTVTAIGPAVTRFHVGERITGRFSGPPIGRGSFAEYAVIAQDTVLTRLPDRFSMVEAAALPVAGLTARALDTAIGPHLDRRILVIGAAGGVGSFFVQFANSHGAYVIATGHQDDERRLRLLGAVEVIDYTQTSVPDQVRTRHPDGVDALIDLVSNPDEFQELLALVRPGGIAFSTVGDAESAELVVRGLGGGNFQHLPRSEDLAQLVQAVAHRRIHVPIERTVHLDELPAVLTATGGQRGKTVAVIGTGDRSGDLDRWRTRDSTR
ncbi:NADP-dependent oxidoreductase [Nocardia arthritidis]|uniref:Zinc-binding dehydrogenase n=1 Tax=Nocardia arthritidis TaxID=228602 RepID=A0A6G9YM15_9NOCA|nr:NADP-dependent oxidoreductase [Nocardia arthritidis]QIS13973.1 zinc-binding dehydrogenase [Nocardia arthritidis]